jgi:hypothetical protein
LIERCGSSKARPIETLLTASSKLLDDVALIR